jgi:hypothetical protein
LPGGAVFSSGRLALHRVALRANAAVGGKVDVEYGVTDNRCMAGAGCGGALFIVGGVLELHESQLTENRAEGGRGIYRYAIAEGCDSTAGCGGAIFMQEGQVTLTQSMIANNQALGGQGAATSGNGLPFPCTIGAGCGGGIFSVGGMVTTSVSLIQANEARGSAGDPGTAFNYPYGGVGCGGGIASIRSELRLSRSRVVGNRAQGGRGVDKTSERDATNGGVAFGGGIATGAVTERLVLEQSVLAENAAIGGMRGTFGPNAPSQHKVNLYLGFAGGIWSYNLVGYPYSGVEVIDSHIDANWANSAAGGIMTERGSLTVRRSSVTNNRAEYFGGISVIDTWAVLDASAIIGNQATVRAGGLEIDDSSYLVARNSTVSGNRVTNGSGGGIAISGRVDFANVTIAANRASSGGGMIRLGTPTLQLRDSIIADNVGGDCGGSAGEQTSAHTLDSDGSCGLTAPTDKPATDPKLGSLADNGGPTLTHALLPGSPAIDAGDPSGCRDYEGVLLDVDQRGVPRPQGARCDIGAYERLASDLQLGIAVTPTTVAPRDLLTLTLSYTNAGPSDVTDATLALTLPTGLVLEDLLTSSPVVTPTPGLTTTWQLPPLAAGATGSLVLRVRAGTALSSSMLTPHASLTSALAADDQLATNQASTPVRVVSVDAVSPRAFVPALIATSEP